MSNFKDYLNKIYIENRNYLNNPKPGSYAWSLKNSRGGGWKVGKEWDEPPTAKDWEEYYDKQHIRKDKKATDKQKNYLILLYKNTDSKIQNLINNNIDKINSKEASDLINLKKQAKNDEELLKEIKTVLK